jgi:L-iditol 2-dehydrogenase
MKSCKLTSLKHMDILDVPMLAVHKGTDVIISVKRVGVCGSDVHYYADGRIGSQIVQYPWTIGHEGAGIVAEVGASVTKVKPGDRIAFDPAMPCGQCQQCLVGRPHTCLNLLFLGCPGQAEGCLSEYLVLPERCCLPIPDTMSLDEAAMVEPLSIALYGATLYCGLKGARVGIFGSGPIGLCLLQAARALGAATICVTDKIEARLEVALALGADWTGNPNRQDIFNDITRDAGGALDVVFECCGQQEAIDTALPVLKPGGELSLIGIPEPNRVSFDINLLRRKEIRIQNVRRQNDCMVKALKMIEDGAVNAKSMITHRFNFDRTGDAFDLVSNYRDGVVKAMISLD